MDQKDNDELLDKAQALLDKGDQESYFKITQKKFLYIMDLD